MKSSNLKILSYAYLIIPIILFVLGWVKLIYSIPIVAMLIYVSVKIYKQCKIEDKDERVLTTDGVCILFICLIIFCILGGHGGLFYQTTDWNERNAILRDLINHEWPVYYEQTNNALTYYIGQWMVPAFLGKIIKFLFASIFGTAFANYSDVGFYIGNIFLLYWNAFGVLLACLWVLKTLKISGKKSILAIILFLAFSGLDILGTIFTEVSTIENLHLEWWAVHYQYSSMVTQLFWVFNQCIPIWIITLMFYNEKRVNNYMLIILLSIPFSPLGTVGLAILFFGRAIVFLVESMKEKKFKEFVKDVFSIQNILALLSIFPIYLLYYLSNASIQGSESGGGFNILWKNFETAYNKAKFLLFLLLEVGIYAIITFGKHKKEPFYYIVFLPLIVIPFFQIGYAYDFSMRVSIPALVVIALWAVECFLERISRKDITKGLIYVCVIIALAGITPAVEIYRGFYWVWRNQKVNNVCDRMKTFEYKENSYNFLTYNPKENSVFYKYIAK